MAIDFFLMNFVIIGPVINLRGFAKSANRYVK